MDATYKIDGMTCGGCVNSVTKALTAALPQATIEVSLERGEVRVQGKHEAAVVNNTVEDAGFDFGGVVGGGQS